jgi:DNA-directed RNA polymerase specialized sigma24 family protein
MFAELPTTRWTQIRAAQGDKARLADLWQDVFRIYWRPLFWLARRKGLTVESASDAVQSFAESAVASGLLDTASESRGRLRSFLAKCFTHHVIGLHAYESAQKRGGRAIHVDVHDLEEQLRGVAPDAETAFEQGWAMSLLEEAHKRLHAEYTRESRSGDLKLLQVYLEGKELGPLAELARAQNVSVPFLKSFFFRGKKRYRELLLEIVQETLDPDEDAALELERLLRSLTS